MARPKKTDKEERIKNKIAELMIFYEEVPESKREIAGDLIKDFVFLSFETEEMRGTLLKDGWREEYQNGATQTGYKKSVIAEMYDKMLKQKLAVGKQLADLLPSDAPPEAIGEFEDWIRGNR